MNKTNKQLEEEVELLSTMLESLVQLLEKKGVMTQSEWEKIVKTNVTVP